MDLFVCLAGRLPPDDLESLVEGAGDGIGEAIGDELHFERDLRSWNNYFPQDYAIAMQQLRPIGHEVNAEASVQNLLRYQSEMMSSFISYGENLLMAFVECLLNCDSTSIHVFPGVLLNKAQDDPVTHCRQ